MSFVPRLVLQAKLVKQEMQNIDQQFERRRKQAEVSQKMYALSFTLKPSRVHLTSLCIVATVLSQRS